MPGRNREWTFSVRALSRRTYTTTFMTPGFKQVDHTDVEVEAGAPGSDRRVVPQVGGPGETVTVQLQMVIHSRINKYNGSLYKYFRNRHLNSNYWFNNRDRAFFFNNYDLLAGCDKQRHVRKHDGWRYTTGKFQTWVCQTLADGSCRLCDEFT